MSLSKIYGAFHFYWSIKCEHCDETILQKSVTTSRSMNGTPIIKVTDPTLREYVCDKCGKVTLTSNLKMMKGVEK